mmetsp:Transcript_15346/g.41719  ORF Transcript_15346/g.41719 Transcript_15346/m.41719 type:complete len:87 (-) Transcript_15346:40-300(-)
MRKKAQLLDSTERREDVEDEVCCKEHKNTVMTCLVAHSNETTRGESQIIVMERNFSSKTVVQAVSKRAGFNAYHHRAVAKIDNKTS